MQSQTSNTSDADLVSIAVDFGGTKTVSPSIHGERNYSRSSGGTSA